MRQLSARERKIVAIFILVLLIALGWLAMVSPLLGGFSARSDQRQLLRMAYERNSRLINAIPALRRRSEQIRPLRAQVALVAPDPAQAQDRLRERLRNAFAEAGGEVTLVQGVPASGDQVRAWVQGKITLEALQKLLVTQENAAPYLVIESLRISADAALETGRLDKLDVRLEASIPYLRAAS